MLAIFISQLMVTYMYILKDMENNNPQEEKEDNVIREGRKERQTMGPRLGAFIPVSMGFELVQMFS